MREEKYDKLRKLKSILSRKKIAYPVGRHEWLVTDPKCDLFKPTW